MSRKPSYEELAQRVRELELAESDRILMEETTRNTSELLSSFIKHSPIADINSTTFLRVNSAFTDILGYCEEELLDKVTIN